MTTPDTSRKFHFLREIASGGFGSVFLAKVIHPDGFSRLAAIKLLLRKWSNNDEIASRMRDEARLLGQLRHRNIVDVADLTMIDGRVAVIMEYLEAVDLKVVISHFAASKQRFPVRVALEITACVASALDAAYNRPPIPGERPLRVIHRDIKPSNIMVDDAGTPKVLDFGVARADFDERESHTQEMAFGSVDYMPPERLFFEPESAASDIYSLGATLFELLTQNKFGKAKLRPAQHEALIDKRLDALVDVGLTDEALSVGEQITDLVSSMLAFDDADRPSAESCVVTMREIARTIRSEETLPEWAERVIPPLVKRMEATERRGPPNALVDQVIAEDDRALPREPTAELLKSRLGVEPLPEPQEDTGLDGLGPEDDARWNALKRATLDEMGDLAHMLTPTPAPMPKSRLTPPPAPPKGVRSALVRDADADPGAPVGYSPPVLDGTPLPPPPRQTATNAVVAFAVLLLFGLFALGALLIIGFGIGVRAGAGG